MHNVAAHMAKVGKAAQAHVEQAAAHVATKVNGAIAAHALAEGPKHSLKALKAKAKSVVHKLKGKLAKKDLAQFWSHIKNAFHKASNHVTKLVKKHGAVLVNHIKKHGAKLLNHVKTIATQHGQEIAKNAQAAVHGHLQNLSAHVAKVGQQAAAHVTGAVEHAASKVSGAVASVAPPAPAAKALPQSNAPKAPPAAPAQAPGKKVMAQIFIHPKKGSKDWGKSRLAQLEGKKSLASRLKDAK
jgi:uncharacterized protein YicC (UPF0701 family)